jgi:hypothetical protein
VRVRLVVSFELPCSLTGKPAGNAVVLSRSLVVVEISCLHGFVFVWRILFASREDLSLTCSGLFRIESELSLRVLGIVNFAEFSILLVNASSNSLKLFGGEIGIRNDAFEYWKSQRAGTRLSLCKVGQFGKLKMGKLKMGKLKLRKSVCMRTREGRPYRFFKVGTVCPRVTTGAKILPSMATPKERGTTSRSKRSAVSAEVAFPERIPAWTAAP